MDSLGGRQRLQSNCIFYIQINGISKSFLYFWKVLFIKKMKTKIIIFTLFSIICTLKLTAQPVIIVKNKEIGIINRNIFGQFLERPSWGGESGFEPITDSTTKRLPDNIVTLFKQMNIPIIRFPAGTDIDYMDWENMITKNSNTKRPISYKLSTGNSSTNNFGYDEFFALCKVLNSEPLIVVNFGNAYFKRKSLQDAANEVAALVAYCNAEVENNLPEYLKKYPQMRMENGHKKPYKVKYWQIANEPWMLDKDLKLFGKIDSAKLDWFFECLNVMIDAMKAVDPSITIILDGNCENIAQQINSKLNKKVDMIACHLYSPWEMKEVKQNDKTISAKDLTPETLWKIWTSTPGMDTLTGLASLQNLNLYKHCSFPNLPIAVTEWNWNGWWKEKSEYAEVFNSDFAKGVGAAGYLHAMMREGDKIQLATQSMLVGSSWGITSVRYSSNSAFEPYLMPTGQVTALYANYCGNVLLDLKMENETYFEQPYKINDIQPSKKVAFLDAVATADNKNIYLHIINKNFTEDTKISLDLSDFGIQKTNAELLSIVPSTDVCKSAQKKAAGILKTEKIVFQKGMAKLIFPKQSVNVIVINKK